VRNENIDSVPIGRSVDVYFRYWGEQQESASIVYSCPKWYTYHPGISISSGKLFSSIPRPPWFACKYNYYHNKCVLRGRIVDFAVVHYIYITTIIQRILCIIVVITYFFHNFPRPTIILYCTSCYYDHRPSRPCRTISGVSLIAHFNVFVSFCLSNIAIRRRTRNIILHSGFTPK